LHGLQGCSNGPSQGFDAPSRRTFRFNRKLVAKPKRTVEHPDSQGSELVIITGLSGSGKATVLKALEDLGYYAVDNLPIGLLPKFSELIKDSPSARHAAIVIDIREGESLKQFPAMFKRIRREVPARLVFLEADDEALVRRF